MPSLHLKLLFQSEAMFEAIDNKTIFCPHANKLIFTTKVLHLPRFESEFFELISNGVLLVCLFSPKTHNFPSIAGNTCYAGYSQHT